MKLELVINGKTHTLEIPPNVKCARLEFDDGTIVESAPEKKSCVPDGALEKTIDGVRCLFYTDDIDRPSVCAAADGRYSCWIERDFNESLLQYLDCNFVDLSNDDDHHIIGDWVRSVWAEEREE